MDTLEREISSHFEKEHPCDPLEACLVHNNNKEKANQEIIEMAQYLDAAKPKIKDKRPEFEPLGEASPKLQPSTVVAPSLVLKPLPSHLRYAFLGENNTLHVIIATNLNTAEEEKLLKILLQHKAAIGWTIADIMGISLPSACTVFYWRTISDLP
ncbi:hypothetical protein L3X38_002798 [Prunus dulcis]|uniref:Uncharacterized protein n=1 Tax=Prunus dulcis TaxID=3755 RepID=A0AAD4WZD0_PRUDU|nr:hypothetical protein L3X38_002798 [Prunus dulcis]